MTDLTRLDLDPAVQAELEALEAALNGEPGADADLLALVEDVRATREPVSLSLRSRLEDGVAAGFPRASRARRAWRLPSWALPAMGVTSVFLIVGVVAFSGLRDDPQNDAAVFTSKPLSDTETSSAGDSASGSAAAGEAAAPEADLAAPTAKTVAPSAAQSSASAAGTVAPAPSPNRSVDKDAVGRERKVERAVGLTLRVGANQLEDASDDIVRATQALGGYVSSSQVSGRDTGGEADFTLRIPSAKLDLALKQLGTFGHIARLDQSSRDITASFVSAEDRLGDARDERAALLKALGRARTDRQVASLKARLAANRGEISRLKGDLDALRRRADLSTIDLHVVASGRKNVVPGGGRKDDGTWSPGDAAGDALGILKVSVGVALVGLAALLPLSILGLLAWFSARGVTRRRREHALDAAA